MWSQNYCISRDPPAATPVGISRCSVSSQDAALLQGLPPASPRSSVSGPPQPAESFAPPPGDFLCEVTPVGRS